ncbi:MAG: hypothetical protein AVDCRST_MAG22-1359, partial [uncultured Rubrobacteraceae bacterium]
WSWTPTTSCVVGRHAGCPASSRNHASRRA